jgi:CPA2 family monovalent cation:H+ antiporter-2
MHSNPVFQLLTGVIFFIILVGFFSKLFKFPNAVAYLLTGLLLGPYGLKFIKNVEVVKEAGDIGVIFLMFFIGMEFSLSKLKSNWKISVLGTFLQILFSVMITLVISVFLGWDYPKAILLGFIISLSSTAMVIKLVQEKYNLGEVVSNDIIGILISQDLAIIPMMIILGILEGSTGDLGHLIYQLMGGLILGLLLFLSRKPFVQKIFSTISVLRSDTEYQVFLSLGLCMGLSSLAIYFHLSEIIGALVAGMIISQFEARFWVYSSLKSLKVILITLFFTSIGMLINLQFFYAHVFTILLFTFLAFFLNTCIIGIILKVSGRSFRQSFTAGAILSQIGELSFMLSSAGKEMLILDDYSYNLAINTISLSILLTPFWVSAVKNILKRLFPEHLLA